MPLFMVFFLSSIRCSSLNRMKNILKIDIAKPILVYVQKQIHSQARRLGVRAQKNRFQSMREREKICYQSLNKMYIYIICHIKLGKVGTSVKRRKNSSAAMRINRYFTLCESVTYAEVLGAKSKMCLTSNSISLNLDDLSLYNSFEAFFFVSS